MKVCILYADEEKIKSKKEIKAHAVGKFLCDNNIGTRSQVKEYIKKGQVTVNDQIIKKPETKVNEETDTGGLSGTADPL